MLTTFNFTGNFWFDIFPIHTKNMSNQKLPVKLKVTNNLL